jgi:hypothetical protein
LIHNLYIFSHGLERYLSSEVDIPNPLKGMFRFNLIIDHYSIKEQGWDGQTSSRSEHNPKIVPKICNIGEMI